MAEAIDKTSEKAKKIDNVVGWMKAVSPSEWQIERIDPELTFSWLMDNLAHIGDCDARLGTLDSAVRESILMEAVARLFDTLVNDSGFVKFWLLKTLKSTKELCSRIRGMRI